MTILSHSIRGWYKRQTNDLILDNDKSLDYSIVNGQVVDRLATEKKQTTFGIKVLRAYHIHRRKSVYNNSTNNSSNNENNNNNNNIIIMNKNGPLVKWDAGYKVKCVSSQKIFQRVIVQF